jgi:transcriptional regulator with XRE-family HTH domain
MTQSNTPARRLHEGRNVKRFREMLGIKQDALAADLSDDWNQQRISLLEQKETIDTPLLAQIAAVLKILVEAIQNLMKSKQSILLPILLMKKRSSAIPAGHII